MLSNGHGVILIFARLIRLNRIVKFRNLTTMLCYKRLNPKKCLKLKIQELILKANAEKKH